MQKGDISLCGFMITTPSGRDIFRLHWSALQRITSIIIMWQLLYSQRRFVNCL